ASPSLGVPGSRRIQPAFGKRTYSGGSAARRTSWTERSVRLPSPSAAVSGLEMPTVTLPAPPGRRLCTGIVARSTDRQRRRGGESKRGACLTGEAPRGWSVRDGRRSAPLVADAHGRRGDEDHRQAEPDQSEEDEEHAAARRARVPRRAGDIR